MKTNLAFHRALISLSHPISIGAILLLLFNDHIWRQVAPSWITGKIGDFAWLIFAPFLLATILAWAMPKRDELVGRGSIIITGLIFALAKTVPAFHAITIKVLETLTGRPNVLRMDPTDLSTLPALLIAWLIWKQSANRSIRWPKRGWILLPLATLATMANSALPLPGIVCLQQEESQIAAPGVASMVSGDGGLTWQSQSGLGLSCGGEKSAQWELTDPADARIKYRFTLGVSIERSDDGGQTWRIELDLTGEDARAAFIRLTQRGRDSEPGPFDAVIDRSTRNVVVAMGHEGVLVRTTDTVWHWVAVGSFGLRPDLHRIDNVVTLLAGEMLYALVLIALMIGTLTRRATQAIWRVALICVAWIGWVMAVIVFAPATSTGYFASIPPMAAIAVAIFAVPMMLGQVSAMIRSNPRALLPTVLIAIAAALLYLLPYVLWTQGAIPFYTSATLYAMALTAATLTTGRFYLRRFLSVPPPAVSGADIAAAH
jgi:hypothetical protein